MVAVQSQTTVPPNSLTCPDHIAQLAGNQQQMQPCSYKAATKKFGCQLAKMGISKGETGIPAAVCCLKAASDATNHCC